MSKTTYSITTTLPYVNADPHIGFALEIIQADVLARWHRLKGKSVVFNTGTDEHGQKIWKNAQEAGMDPKAYCDQYAAKFHGLKEALNLTYTHFIRTTDEHHIKAAQEFWKRCDAAGDIYKKQYQVKYCVGCELEKTDSELVDGKCPIHPKLEIENRDEENYFFRWSKYQDALLKHYKENPQFVMPESRLHEISKFVEGGLQDFSISRLKEKMPWGIAVPGDEAHVMYVWFDALVNYISTLGWPDEKYAEFWPNVQVAGKDNLRQQSAMWQGMLLSAGVPLSKQIFIHGFITADGQKMSKSLGNVVNPYDLVSQYGTDPLRYFLLGALPSYEDGDYSKKHFEETYTAKLVNGIGNLAARTATMVEKYCEGKAPAVTEDRFETPAFWKAYEAALDAYRFDEAMRVLEHYVTAVNQAIDVEAPFKKAKLGEDVSPFMYQIAEALRHIATALLPVIPAGAEKVLSQLSIDPASVTLPAAQAWGGLEPGTSVKKGDILFPRLAP
ncbi:MAG: methionine--tRNA ligase [Patescibacteria group bacterium]|nr:MAG: methionine--tRNA ligase [Patescibacteria group bacterium]